MKSERERLHLATNCLVEQQFYKVGRDIIVGRTPSVSVKISKSGQIVKKFKDLFLDNLDFFLKGKYFNFLQPFKKIKGLNDAQIQDISEELDQKFNELQDSIDEIVVIYTIVTSVIISRIRDLHFNESIEEIKKRTKKKVKSLSKIEIQDQLNQLFMVNDDNISILYNLSYLDALAESFNYNKVAKICKIQKGKYINRVVKKIIASKKKKK
ncbi:MAG: hypothetical protein GF383_11690 [Candidatus Lokiarchaeota archaeon]|nr:hypothetical protein [Candidatus Lokiarchaeota archaeon]MBD3341428.1 hypothetical protein [Candidatus Lokiarchaeota archaeon]